MVFSSTFATFGDPVRLPMNEPHPQATLNPYGRSKLMGEQALAEYSPYAGFRSVCLRYFNAAGADEEERIGERHEPEIHLVELAGRDHHVGGVARHPAEVFDDDDIDLARLGSGKGTVPTTPSPAS